MSSVDETTVARNNYISEPLRLVWCSTDVLSSFGVVHLQRFQVTSRSNKKDTHSSACTVLARKRTYMFMHEESTNATPPF